MRYCTILFLLVLIAFASTATFGHEYWLEPDTFFLKTGERTPLRLFVGEGLKKEEERVFQASKTTMFKLFSSASDFDLTASATDNSSPILAGFSADITGNYLVAMERNWSYITLEADKFTDYLREDGMDYIVAERTSRSETKTEGKERYSRFIKGLMQVGDKRDNTYAKTVGLKLEIVPLENPYAKRVGNSLRVQVLFNGTPLSGKTIFADNRDGENVSKQKLVTDAKGICSVKLDRKGTWLVRLVYMQRCTANCEGADWESFWGALSFGLK